MQSLPRIDRATRAPAAVSGGADWGNVRYGKGFRTQIAMDALARHADLHDDFALLDVGSNRGSFARAFLDAAPERATSPRSSPTSVSRSPAPDLPRTATDPGAHRERRARDRPLRHRSFLPHDRASRRIRRASLADHWRVLKHGGLLILDAPNTALLGGDDIVEEWFIDKHLYHFSARTLIAHDRGGGL